MTNRFERVRLGALLVLALVAVTPAAVQAQGRGHGRGHGNGHGGGGDDGARVEVTTSVGSVDVTLSAEMRREIQTFYANHPVSGAESLPPGIRRNLARGKPLPPGIAKKMAPAELRSRVHLRDGYELVEVGLDVFLVEVATNVVHDVLMDVIR